MCHGTEGRLGFCWARNAILGPHNRKGGVLANILSVPGELAPDNSKGSIVLSRSRGELSGFEAQTLDKRVNELFDVGPYAEV